MSTASGHQLTCTFSHHGLADTNRILPSDTLIWEMLGSRLLVCSGILFSVGAAIIGKDWTRIVQAWYNQELILQTS